MHLSFDNVILWAHLVCMVGTFGGLLVMQVALPASARSDEAIVRGGLRFLSFLLLAGMVVGFVLYYNRIQMAKAFGGSLHSKIHMAIGIKFLIMIVVGGCFGAASGLLRKGKPKPSNALRWLSLILLGIAALLGVAI